MQIIEINIFPNNVINQGEHAAFSEINRNISKYGNKEFDAVAMVNVMVVINSFIHVYLFERYLQ